MLTEAVRRNPYSVVLLDEAEKAHPDVLELFYQVFDKGVMDDAEGREIDFRHCVIILTSNVGAAQIQQASAGYCSGEAPDADALTKALHPVLAQTFRPALLGRMQVVPYFAVADAALDRIVRLKLDRIAARLVADHQAQLSYDDRFVQAVKVRCTEVDSGARNIDHILDGTVLPTIAGHVLQRMASGEPLRRIHVGADTTGGFAYSVL